MLFKSNLGILGVKSVCLVILTIAISACFGQPDRDRGELSINGFFYMAIFNGLLPVPSRYIVYPGGDMDEKLMLESRPLVQENRPERGPLSAEVPSGRIFVGSRADCNICGEEERALELYETVSSVSWKNDTTVVSLYSNEQKTIYVYDASNYLMITDDYVGLWDEMAAGFLSQDF